MRKEFDRAAMLGIGIDEDVAIVVRGDYFEVIGKEGGEVLVYDPRKWVAKTSEEEKWERIRTGGAFDLKSRKIIERRGAGL